MVSNTGQGWDSNHVGGIGLAANTTYFLVIDSTSTLSSLQVARTDSDSEDSGGAAGWSIADVLRVRDFHGTGTWFDDTDNTTLSFAVHGYARGGGPSPPPPVPVNAAPAATAVASGACASSRRSRWRP